LKLEAKSENQPFGDGAKGRRACQRGPVVIAMAPFNTPPGALPAAIQSLLLPQRI
jgi:hypothetical protein